MPVTTEGIESNCAVRFIDVYKHYGALQVLSGINLAVAQGERISLCGPSGSGKSTLLRCVIGLETISSGKILIGAEGLDSQNPASCKGVGMVFQHFNLFPHKTVLQNCMLAPRRAKHASKAEARDVAMHYLRRVRIDEKADKYPIQLSGGQQQRVAIARALCMNPKIMLFDEPTSALDPELIKEVLDTIIELTEDDMTMICVTHEMGFARSVAHRIAFMDGGKIVEVAAPDKFFNSPQHERSKSFLEIINNNTLSLL